MRSLFRLIKDIFRTERLFLDRYPFLNLRTKKEIDKILTILSHEEIYPIYKVNLGDVFITPVYLKFINSNTIQYDNNVNEVIIEYRNNDTYLKTKNIIIISQNENLILKKLYINDIEIVEYTNVNFDFVFIDNFITEFRKLKLIIDISLNDYRLSFPLIYIVKDFL